MMVLMPAVVFAHPHMFLTSTEEFVWEKDRLAGCWIEWEFDQFFSADIIQAYDHDGNGKFSAAETKEVFNGAFINLKPGTDGLLHISRIANKRVEKVEDVLSMGEQVLVRVIDIDPKSGKISLTRKDMLPPEK